MYIYGVSHILEVSRKGCMLDLLRGFSLVTMPDEVNIDTGLYPEASKR
jgi:hypothetical protein